MSCYPCEETARGTGCSVRGVCSKVEELCDPMDVLLYLARGIAVHDPAVREAGGAGSHEARMFIADALFATLTNFNFDHARIRELIRKALAIRAALPPMGAGAPDAATWTPAFDAEIDAKAKEVGVLATENEDVRSLRWMMVYGLKGMAAYYHHAAALGYTDDAIGECLERGLAPP